MGLGVQFWPAIILLLPLCVFAISFFKISLENLRSTAIVFALAEFFCSFIILLFSSLDLLGPHVSLGLFSGFGEGILVIDRLWTPLLPFAAALWLLTVASTPSTRLDRKGLARTALSTELTMLTFLSSNYLLLALIWICSLGVYLAAISSPEFKRAYKVVRNYVGLSWVLFLLAVMILTLGETSSFWGEKALWIMIVALMISKGIFPFHAWIPEAFDYGRHGPATLFCSPQVGNYIAAIIVLPLATELQLEVLMALSLFTSVYAVTAAITQSDARRVCGYLFVSQSSLVMAGLASMNVGAISGALMLWISSGLGFAGLSRCILVLEARRGRLNLKKYHGGYERTPYLATSFLVIGFACAGFPGTLGFIAEEMLISGTIKHYPPFGFAVILSGALTAICVLQMYFSLFCGERETGIKLRILAREAWSFVLTAGVLLLLGFLPQAFLGSSLKAAEIISSKSRTENYQLKVIQ